MVLSGDRGIGHPDSIGTAGWRHVQGPADRPLTVAPRQWSPVGSGRPAIPGEAMSNTKGLLARVYYANQGVK